MLEKDAKPSGHGRLQDSQSRLDGVLGTGTLGRKQLPVEMRLEGWVSRAELALFLLSCIESMVCFLVESRFSLVNVFCSSAVPGFGYGASGYVQEPLEPLCS